MLLYLLQAAFPEGPGPAGEVWVSYSDFNGLRFSQILVLNLAKRSTYTMYPGDTGIYSNDVRKHTFSAYVNQLTDIRLSIHIYTL